MNAGNIFVETSHGATGPKCLPVALLDARDGAHRALFSAASRVLSYHAAALDARVARILQLQPDDVSDRDAGLANG